MSQRQFSYPYLRGLLSIPVGIFFLLVAPSNLEWGPFRHLWVFWACVVVGLVAYLVTLRYYRDNYGQVTVPRKRQVRDAVVTIIGILVVVGGMRLDWSLHLPIMVFAAALALVMLAFYGISVGPRAHHVAIWGSLAMASLIPVWGGLSADQKSALAFGLIGIATIATGIFDHILLVRTFRAAKALSLENSNARA